MAVNEGVKPISEFEQWYIDYDPEGNRDGSLDFRAVAPCGDEKWRMWMDYKREMDARVHNYDVLEKISDGEVIKIKEDLPNISSGETAGLVRRIARNLVQHTPNVEVLSKFDDDEPKGIFAKYILTSKIIGSDGYSNDMQQSLFASTKSAFTLGFDAVLPVLLQDATGGWYVKYDSIHYRDVFPEPGCKDVREANYVFVRRYLTKGDVQQIIRLRPAGWDIAALKAMLINEPYARESQSVDHQSKKRGLAPSGYEIITWYSNTGDPFLTFAAGTKMLLRIEKNKHPLKEHPVHFLVLEKDDQQPLGKSQVELLVGRQDFQDLMLNGAMKLWYRNINPPIISYGAANAIPNLGPGKYTQISNPNARLEPFEVNTQTLLQYGAISQQNMGSMINLTGVADQQMASQAGNGGMSATPQGVDAQQALVDTTTNNYQKAIEGFFSRYCAYALSLYFAELSGIKEIEPSADARRQLIKSGVPEENFDANGVMKLDFDDMAIPYYVRCVPGSLVEMEDEKQLRLLNELFVPLSQAMPALAATQDQEIMQQAGRAMQYIIAKQIELSGSVHAKDIGLKLVGEDDVVQSRDQKLAAIEETVGGFAQGTEEELEITSAAVAQLQAQVGLLTEGLQTVLQKLGAIADPSASGGNSSTQGVQMPVENDPTVELASA